MYTDRLPAFESDDMTSWEGTILAAKSAYEQAGITSKDVDFVELHDAFTSVELIAYEDLGTEAIRRLVIEDFPAIVADDIYGADLYEIEQVKYRREG